MLRDAAGVAGAFPTEPEGEELVLAQRVALLHARSLVAQITVVVNASIVTVVFWGRSPGVASLAWLATLCALAVARAVLSREYLRRVRAPAQARSWARLHAAGAALNGVGWGAAALIFHVEGSPAHQMFIAFVLGGMAAGAAASSASYTPAFAAFAVPALLPIAVRFATQRDPIHLAMSFMLALFGLAMAEISRAGGRLVERAIRLRLRNEALVAHLSAASERLEALNAGLEQRVAERTAELERVLRLRLESEARLARFRALLDQVGDAVFIARAADLAVVDVNSGACELLGGAAEALVGRRLDELPIAASLDGPATREVVQSLRAGEVRMLQDRSVDGGGPPRALELSIAVRHVDGQRYVLVVARDVSARKEMENKLAQTGLLASLGSLAAGVAHELNNPLAYILANLQHLSDRLAGSPSLSTGEKAELAQVMADSIDGALRARDIVGDLRSLSPRERQQPEPIDVHAVLQSCLNVAMNEIRHRARLVRDLRSVPPVMADRTRLAQVFTNLLVNAAQAIPEGNASAQRITVSTRHDEVDGMVHVDVADTGSGIPRANLQRIFEPFFTTKGMGRGTGLGLSICHGIVSSLGGRIAVRSREGEGSTFTVSLPAAPATATPEPRLAAAPPHPSESERRARVLIVDDDPAVARAIRRALVQDDVTVAIGGAAGVAALEKGRFDVVLCDVMMPDLTGIDVHRRLAELRPGAERAMVFVTGGTFTDSARAFLDSVSNPRLTKPFEIEEVRAAVRLALARGRR